MEIKSLSVIRDGGTVSIKLVDDTELFIPAIAYGVRGIYKDYEFKNRIKDSELSDFSTSLSTYYGKLKSSNGTSYQFYLIGYVQGYLECNKSYKHENRND